MIIIPLVGVGLLWVCFFVIVSSWMYNCKREVRVPVSIISATVVTGVFFWLLGLLDGDPGIGALCGFVVCPLAGLALSFIYLRKLL